MAEIVEIEKLSWSDVRQRLDDDWTTAVFSVGAIEQHGPHLPTMTDSLLGGDIAARVAAELGKALVAPTIRPGNSPASMAFAGTTTLRLGTISALIVDYCTSLARHGFKELVVISSHGGNTSVVKSGSQEAQVAVGEEVDVIAITNLMGYLDPSFD